MRKKCILFSFFMSFAWVFAQDTTKKVGVNTDKPAETLEVNGTIKTILPKHNTEKIYNGEAERDTKFIATKKVLANDDGVLGAIPWKGDWFYMPSVVLPLTTADRISHPDTTHITESPTGTFTMDLYEIYKEQFGANAYEKNNLEAVVLYYDKNVFENVSITDNKLTYTVKSTTTTAHTYMNIIFKVK